MRSNGGRNGKWESSLVPGGGYSSSEDDEMTRLKPTSNTSTSGSSNQQRSSASKPSKTNYRTSNSEGATSPNESDNTYAEASLLQSGRPIRYDLGYDSEIYANDQLVNPNKYSPRSPPISGTNSRFMGTHKNPEAANKSPFMNQQRTTSRNGGRKMKEVPPPLPAANAIRGPRQMTSLADVGPRGWDNGVGGYQTNTMLETRIGNNGLEDYVKLGNFTMMGDRRNRQPLAFGAKTASLHRRSLSDDSLKPSHPNSPGQLGQEPIVMPGFPVRTLQAHPPPPYSPSREKFLLTKRCRFHCSWKLVALSLTVLTLILSSVIAYFGAVKFPGTSSHVVQPPQTDSAVISAASSSASNGLECPPTLQEQPQAVIPQGYTPSVSTASSVSIPFKKRHQTQPDLVIPGQWYTSSIAPMEMWTSQMNVPHSNTHLVMNLTVLNSGRVASIAIYGKSEGIPSVTNYDWVHIVAKDGKVLKRETGGVGLSLSKELNQRGTWYFGVLNDNEDLISVRTVMDQVRNGGKSCPADCNGQGRCQDGVCMCFPQYTGTDCSQSICPLLCSGHGVYGGGQCHCVDGWKGPECEVRSTECVIADCSRHGQCREGVCICNPGWTGEHCQTRDCVDRSCNGRGTCQDATCICDIGWMGPNCEQRNEALYQCLPDCSGHGLFNVDLGKCECQPKWTGRDCNITVCGFDCGPNGQCLGSSCVCNPGWSGPRCNLKACDDRCKEHGQCINGTCVCQPGFNGFHCGFDACKGNCFQHGECINMADDEDNQRPFYECQCHLGWTGDHCQIPEEMECEDGIDNDNNGLTDCGDSKCCSHPSCRNSIMCMYLEDPVEVLLRKPPPAVAAPFLKRVQFLFEGEDSVQNYAKQDAFDDRRVSIIRGRVVTMTGQGIIGVRVSVDRTKDANNYGFTLTRPGGWFDMAVNGGGGVTLQFQRSPLKATTRTIYVAWNRMVVINPVIMTPHGGAGLTWGDQDTFGLVKYSQPCLSHDYGALKPTILTSYVPQLASSRPKIQSGILAESEESQENIHIPGTQNLHLIYRSSSGALATIDMVLIDENVPHTLVKVHTIVRVAGNVFEKKFQPDTDLRYTFGWDKTNIYNQKVYGLVKAEVSIGYEYSDCVRLIWSVHMVKLRGFDVDISGIKNWNLNIHHHYNPYQGVLQKGDGSMIDLTEFYPKRVTEFMGNGEKRDFDCGNQCNTDQFLNVVSLASGPDGSIYVGDFNLIKKITPDKQIIPILQFEDSQRAFDYDLKFSPSDSHLYIAHAKKHQIWAVKNLQNPKNLKANYKIVVGTGDRCIPGDSCGDFGPADKAKLNYPKGLAIALDGTIYISDGRNIRVVTPQGQIQTLIGTNDRSKGPPRPLPCQKNFKIDDSLQLQWPTKMALNPLDSTLYIVDDTMILKLTPDLNLQVVSGISPMCTSQNQQDFMGGNQVLGPIVDLGFDSDGHLYFISRKPPQKMAALHKNNHIVNGSIGSISALTVSPSGALFLAENKDLKILSYESALPLKNDKSGEVQVQDSLAGLVYTFNRFSQHISTHLMETGAKLYTFVYTKNTALGKLSDVTDSIGNSISLQRDYTGKVKTISNTLGQKFDILLTPMGHLEAFDDLLIEYKEHGALLKSIRYPNGNFRAYQYDFNGNVKSASDQSGTLTSLQTKPCQENMKCILLDVNGQTVDFQLGPDGQILFKEEKGNPCASSMLSGQQEWRVSGLSCSHLRLLRAPTAHPTLMTPLNFGKPTSQWLTLPPRESASNLLTWTHKSEIAGHNYKQLEFGSSGVALVGVQYDATSNEETFYNGQGQRLLSVKYKSGLLATQWSLGLEPNCSQTFDRIHRLVERRCGQVTESFGYNEHNGRLEETRKSCQRRPTQFTYAPNSHRPRDLILPSGKRFSFEYDPTGLTGIRFPGGNGMLTISSQSGILGQRKVYLRFPGLTDPFVTHWQGSNLVQIRRPSGDANVLYKYNPRGLLLQKATGDSLSLYEYRENILTHVNHLQEGQFSMKITFISDVTANQRLLEERYDFDARSRLASAKLDYVFKDHLTSPILQGRIGAKSLPEYFIHHGWSSLKKSQNIGQFVIHPHDLNVSSITDGIATFTFGSNFDVLMLNGREVFRAEHTMDSCGKVDSSFLKMVKGNAEFKQTWKYLYDDDGKLETASIVDNSEWRYSYDSWGNLISVTSGLMRHKLNFEYDSNGLFKGPKVRYDENGNIISHLKGGEMSYDTRGRLSSVTLGSSITIKYHYDHRGRLLARNSNGDLTQYFYSAHKPNLISHVYKPQTGQLTTLLYNHQDRLIFMAIDNQEFYVTTDKNGSPLLVLTPDGGIIKEITRTPYGDVTYDSNQNLEIPLGFQGGYYDNLVNLVHFQPNQEGEESQAYDPLTGSFLSLQWRKIFGLEKSIEDMSSLLSLYRYPGNDPINAKFNPFQDPQSLLEGIRQHLRMSQPVSLNLEQWGLFSSFMSPLPSTSLSQIVSQSNFLGVLDQMHHLSSVPSSTDLSTKISQSVLWAISTSPMGKFVSLSQNRKNQVIINSVQVDGANEIPRQVFRHVLTSAELALRLEHGPIDAFYFVKENIYEASNDIQFLRKLGPSVNLTSHDSQSADGSVMMDVKVHLENTVISLRYGASAETERGRILRHAAKVTVRRAWQKQKELLINKKDSQAFPWSPKEKEQLLRQGNVPNYQAQFYKDLEKFPELASDLSNVNFVKNKKP